LKRRSYYGFGKFGTEVGNKEQKSYAVNMKSKLIKINVVEFVSKNKNTLLIGLGLLAIAGSFYLYKKNN
jgi:LPXTG-motif cell wall-anchored protein